MKPFRAWHYQSKKVDIERVIAPPYDIISENRVKELHERDPYNVIRLILGQAKPEDVKRDSKYQAANKFLTDWTRNGILTQEKKTGFYLHEMSFRHPFRNQTLSRLAVYALLKLEPFDRKTVFRHEHTHALPKEDRGKLLRHTQANFSPIFSVYEDATDTLDQVHAGCGSRKPLFDFSDDESTHHKVWLLSESSEVTQVTRTLEGKSIFIADGHHRYETALHYAMEKNSGEKTKGEHSWDYVLSSLVRITDPGLLMLPIHRVILNSVPFDRERVLTGLKKHFILHPVSRSVLERISSGSIAEGFGLALSGEEYYSLELKDQTTARQAMLPDKSKTWYDLDVNVVTHLVLEPLFGLRDRALERNVFYTPSVEDVLNALKQNRSCCSIVIRPMRVGTVKMMCEAGELMPQKSTYFYPKFPSGLLMYRH